MKNFWGKFKVAFGISFSFLIAFWVVQLLQMITGKVFSHFGVLPRVTEGLWGILTSPFIHGDLNHIVANSLPFLVLATMLFFFYEKRAYPIFIFIWILSGLFTWVIGRESWHIGASSVIYGLASFLLFAGIFSYRIKLILISIVVIALYSGMLWGVFPANQAISWEGHLSGAIAGLLIAYLYRKTLRNITK